MSKAASASDCSLFFLAAIVGVALILVARKYRCGHCDDNAEEKRECGPQDRIESSLPGKPGGMSGLCLDIRLQPINVPHAYA